MIFHLDKVDIVQVEVMWYFYKEMDDRWHDKWDDNVVRRKCWMLLSQSGAASVTAHQWESWIIYISCDPSHPRPIISNIKWLLLHLIPTTITTKENVSWREQNN